MARTCGLTAILSLEDEEENEDKTADGEDDVGETPGPGSQAFAVRSGFIEVEHFPNPSNSTNLTYN